MCRRLLSQLCLSLALTLSGCGGSRLPGYAAPEGMLVSEAEAEGGDLIEYRTLSRADFQGTSPRGAAAAHADRLGAQTYALIKHQPGIRFEGREFRDESGKKRVEGKIQSLTFVAYMDRSKSWWNPKPGVAPESYVLEHEQIHFAFFEIEAARMNEQAKELTSRTFRGDSTDELQREIQEQIDDIVKEGLARLLDRNELFDEDTSARYAPKKQAEWLERVQRELSEAKAR